MKTEEPKILSANTYFWNSGLTAAARRGNEIARIREVSQFFSSLGFSVTEIENGVEAVLGNLVVQFKYSESCNFVYKNLSVKRDGKKSNITAVRKLYQK